MPTKIIVDCSTGEVQEIELTAEEIKEQKAAQLAAENQKAAAEAEAAAKAEAKAALLDKLGITAEEAQLLLG